MGSNTRHIWRWTTRLSYSRRILPNHSPINITSGVRGRCSAPSPATVCFIYYYLVGLSLLPMSVSSLVHYPALSVSLAPPSLSPLENPETVFFHRLLGAFPLRLFIDHPKEFLSLRYTGRQSRSFLPVSFNFVILWSTTASGSRVPSPFLCLLYLFTYSLRYILLFRIYCSPRLLTS